MPDGKRKRRHSRNRAKRLWYAIYRSRRFARRFGNFTGQCDQPLRQLINALPSTISAC